MGYFYGPVPSRRLGFSLGVDLIPTGKICSFDCIYCQVGKTTRKTIRRFSYVKLDNFNRELKEIIDKHPKIEYITIAGSGEPTLHKSLDKIILNIKKITQNKIPVCVITNSSLLYRKDVRKELGQADLIIPSLDAVFQKVFARINHPHKKINLEKIIEGIIKLRREFKGEIWLEIMLVGGVNDTLKEAKKLKEIIEKVSPDKVQLNIPVRPPVSMLTLPSFERVKEIKRIIGGNVEILSRVSSDKQVRLVKEVDKEILKYLKRRPATFKDLTSSLGISSKGTRGVLDILLKEKKIKEVMFHGSKYFKAGNYTLTGLWQRSRNQK